MIPRSSPALVAMALVLAACGSVPPAAVPSPVSIPAARQDGQFNFNLASGPYNCDEGVRLQVEREYRAGVNAIVRIRWNGGSYRLERSPSKSGLPRFEDGGNGLVWIDLPTKSLLLDSKNSAPLANECRSL